MFKKQWDELIEDEKKIFFDKAAILLNDLYYCNRVWSAWSYGTMTENDFSLANEDDDILYETAEELFNIIKNFA